MPEIKKQMKEIWKDINNYEGIYQCSNLGRIRSLDRYVYEHSGKKQFRKGQIMKLRLNPNGYFQVPLNKNGKRKMCSVHILVAKTFLKQRYKTDIVNHKDGNKQNNNLENLEWISYSENNKHSYNTLNRKIARIGGRPKPIIVENILSGEVQRYISIADASRNINLSHTQINRYIDSKKIWKGRYRISSDNTKCVEDSKMVS